MTNEQRNFIHALELQFFSLEIFDENPNAMFETVVIDVDDECVPLPKILKKVVVNVNCKFQKIWAMKMPWVEPIFNEVRLVSAMNVVFVPKFKGRKKNWLLNRTLLLNIQVRIRVLMVNGSWIQNVCKLKMKSLMLNFLQPLFSSSYAMVRQWKTR